MDEETNTFNTKCQDCGENIQVPFEELPVNIKCSNGHDNRFIKEWA